MLKRAQRHVPPKHLQRYVDEFVAWHKHPPEREAHLRDEIVKRIDDLFTFGAVLYGDMQCANQSRFYSESDRHCEAYPASASRYSRRYRNRMWL